MREMGIASELLLHNSPDPAFLRTCPFLFFSTVASTPSRLFSSSSSADTNRPPNSSSQNSTPPLMAGSCGRSLHRFIFVLSILMSSLGSSSAGKDVVVSLSHALAGTRRTSTPDLIKSSSARSATRFHRRRSGEVALFLSPSSDYTMKLSVGSRKEAVKLYMDTGSDLVWFPCHPFECILCEGKPRTHPFNSSTSIRVPCKSPLCSAAHSSLPVSDLCAISSCSLDDIETLDCSSPCPPFYYAYGDGSLVANLHHDDLLLPVSKPTRPFIKLKNFTFGCAHTSLAEPIGVAGFGPGALSMTAQLASLSPHLGNRFSYCLVSHSFKPDRLTQSSPLILGRSEIAGNGEEDFVYTPLLDNPKHPYYYSVSLDAVSVGGRRIPAPENLKSLNAAGDGGLVVDSGTTFTMLPAKFYSRILEEFDLHMLPHYRRASETERTTGLRRCYFYRREEMLKVPAVAFHFAGNATVVLPRRNYFTGFTEVRGGRKGSAGCLMLMSGGEEAGGGGGGPAGSLGNFQQQRFEVLYDLRRRQLGFARRRCASLWHTPSHR